LFTWSATLFALVLLLVAVAMLLSHHRTWQRVRRQESDAEEFAFRQRQFRRRFQTTGLLVVLALALLVGQWIVWPPLLVTVYWIAVLLLILWVTLLAAVDAWATRHHYARLRHEYLLEKHKLEAEVRRIKKAESNGEAEKPLPRKTDRST